MFRRRNRNTPDQTGPDAQVGPAGQDERAVGPVEHLDDAGFMDGTAGRWTLVDFWADWCAPCKAFAPVFERTAAEYEGRVTFAKIDVEVAPRSAQMVGIRSIPTLVLFDPDGNEAQRASGALAPKHLKRFIEDALANQPIL